MPLLFAAEHRLPKKLQEKLDSDLAFTIAIENLPLNILRRPRFRKWVHVSHESEFT